MLKPFVVLSAALVVFAFSTVTTFAAGGPPQSNPVKSTAASLDKAKKLYAVDCAVCHGDNGNGKTDLATSLQVTLLDWTDPKSLASKSDQDLFDAIRKGKDKMPAEDATRAKNDDVWGLVNYLRQFSKNGPAAAPGADAPATTPAPAADAPAAPATPPPAAPNTKR
jgi:mono/diheme cytochrome c family protein